MVLLLAGFSTQGDYKDTGHTHKRYSLFHYDDKLTKIRCIFIVPTRISFNSILKDFENASHRLNPLFHKP